MPGPLSTRDLELLEMPPVMSQFPLEFDNQTCWEGFDGECNSCGCTLPIEQVRGLVSRPIASVAVIEAVGVCHSCKVLTHFDYRLHDDMRITGQREDGWHTWRAEPSIWERLDSVFKRFLVYKE